MKQEAVRPACRVLSRSWLLPLGLSLAAAVWLAIGTSAVWHEVRSASRPYRGPAGLLIVACAGLQILVARRAWRGRHDPRAPRLHHTSRVWRWWLAGVPLCYGLGLLVGPAPEVRYLYRGLLAGGYTTGLLPWLVPPAWSAYVGHLLRRRTLRLSLRVAFALIVFAAGAELAMRGAGLMSGEGWTPTDAVHDLKLTPGSSFAGRTVNRWGYWDDDFELAPRPGRVRVAAIGRGLTLSGTVETNCLEQIERTLPGIDVYNFGLSQSCPSDLAAQLADDVLRFKPDLVLVFVALGDDLQPAARPRAAFDWRNLRLSRWAASRWGLVLPSAGVADEATASATNYDEHLWATARRLSVCRTPIDDAMQASWARATRELDRALRVCQRREVPLALVLVPGDFQVSDRLREVSRRRAGLRPEQLDLDLPQRRLAGFAQDRSLPVVDLLPHFRAASKPAYCQGRAEPSEHGHRVASQVIGGYLQARFGALLASRER